MSDQNLQNFIGLSSALTGLASSKLAPSIDPINLPPLFFATAQDGLGAAVLSNLLEQYASLEAAGKTPDQIAAAVLANPGSQTAQGARSIMKLWLLGIWYQPFDQGNRHAGDQQVVSDQAYKESWAWRIAQAHPMGYSQFHFGYWAAEPPSLEDFTGVPANGGPSA
ncbi:sorbitol dehydrogenase [Pseudomonas sp. CR3202]|uniref:sorbitol dehydrogenase n=1 Tax=Pseudomonas sp. CR3202 TaxID=3351532 RepID=UPI003BF05746